MHNHPINLFIRFLLEITAVVTFSIWGWKNGGSARYLLAIVLPVAAMAIWAIFRVPGDPGNAPVATKGIIRLLIESLFFGMATVAFFSLSNKTYSWIFLSVLVLHYVFSYERVARFLKH